MAGGSRQARSRARWLTASAACLLLALGAGVEQIAANGWSSFAFRGPGIGASAEQDAPDTSTAAAPAPTPRATASPQPAPTTAPAPPAVEALPMPELTLDQPLSVDAVARLPWRPPANPARHHRPPRPRRPRP